MGDLPVIGTAFRFRTYSNKKLELLIIMTPHIVRNREERECILAEEARRIDWDFRDVMRVHGSGNSMPEFMSEPHSKTQPFRIYPGRPGWVEMAPPALAPAENTPVAPQPSVQPPPQPSVQPPPQPSVQPPPQPAVQSVPQSSKAPIGRGGLLQSIMGRRGIESAPEPTMLAAPLTRTTVQYLPTTPGLPAPPPVVEPIPPGSPTPPAPMSTGPDAPIQPNSTTYWPTKR